jgi:CRISPR system Cascade subunit CasD
VTSFLRFTIFAPLASWGDPAVGEIRGSWDRPSRSAILGIVAAALGTLRDDDNGHARLDASLGVAVRLLAPGEPLIDYHTTQNPKANVVKKRNPATRRIALDLDEPATALSRRWLRQDALYSVAAWLRPNASIELEKLMEALRSPSFTLYAGRKANALGLPLGPLIVVAESLADALRDDPVLPPNFTVLRPRGGWGMEVAYDPCDGFEAALMAGRSLSRRDAAPVRSRWQFSDRTVFVGRIPSGPLP